LFGSTLLLSASPALSGTWEFMVYLGSSWTSEQPAVRLGIAVSYHEC
jgi:hypothetical protein